MSTPPRRVFTRSLMVTSLLASAGLSQVAHADEPEPDQAEAPAAPELQVVVTDPALHFSFLDEGDTATDPDDEFRVADDGSQMHQDTVTIDFEGASRDVNDARVQIVALAFPDAAAATMAWVLTNTKNGTRRTMVVSEEEGWFAWSDGTTTDVYSRAEDGSVHVNGEPFAAFKERPAGPLYRDATPALLAAWVGLTRKMGALNRAFPTSVNSEITDAITQTNTKVFGDAPPLALGDLYRATSQALANAAHNATNAQQQSYITMQAATTMGVSTLYSLDTAATGDATKSMLGQ